MTVFNYPTQIYYGEGSVVKAIEKIRSQGLKSTLLVTDSSLVKLGIAARIQGALEKEGLKVSVFDGTHPNPIEEDVEKGSQVFLDNQCDHIVALGGGSPMDAAKGIMVYATQEAPFSRYDDTKGGDRFIDEKLLPPLFAIPTTAGTGSEVGRSGVIILKETGLKTIIFHPKLMPEIAVLEPELTVGLPRSLTLATGLDAFTHCLEAFLAPHFNPILDGIAIEGIQLIIKNLPCVLDEPNNLEARGQMLMAASMGATAFQRGLGMIHSMAHPLSSECGLHHGLANALCLPFCLGFIEEADLTEAQSERVARISAVMSEHGLQRETLYTTFTDYFEGLGLSFGLSHQGVKESQLVKLSQLAYKDPCHANNLVSVTEEQFLQVFQKAF